jgi:di/tricarboxylate transporter
MVGANVLTLDEAYRAINFDTIILLFGMMILVANPQLSGFFSLIAERVVEHAHRPVALLAAVVLVAGFFSAFFVNDTVCLVLTPLVLEITSSLRRNPVPYLLRIAMGANIGSTAAITGNPQNMLSLFAARLAPVAMAGLLIAIALIYLAYRSEFRAAPRVDVERRAVRIHPALMWKSIAVSIGTIAFFFAGWPVPKVAIVAGAIPIDHSPREARKSIPPDRLELARDVRGTVRRNRRSRKSYRTRPPEFRRNIAPGKCLCAERILGGTLEHSEQRPGGVGIQTGHDAHRGSYTCMAHAGDVLDAGRQPDGAGVGGEPDRDSASEAHGRDRLLGVLPRGRAVVDRHDSARGGVAGVVLSAA